MGQGGEGCLLTHFSLMSVNPRTCSSDLSFQLSSEAPPLGRIIRILVPSPHVFNTHGLVLGDIQQFVDVFNVPDAYISCFKSYKLPTF